MNQIESLIRERRTIQKFSQDPVPLEDVRSALELALWAPNHHLTFAAKFTLIGAKVRDKIVNMAVELKSQGREIPDQVKEIYAGPWKNPAHLVVVRQVLADNEKTRTEDYAFIAAGLQNAALYLWSRGIGSKWSTAKMIDGDEFYAVVGVDRTKERIVGVIMIGHEQEVPEASPRPALETVLSFTE